MSLKTIKVNPDLLSLSGGGSGGGKSSSANTKTRKQKPAGISLTQSNNVKKKLIARIKNFQQKPVNTSIGIQQEVNNGQSNSLTESIDFLNNLAREKQEQKREKRVKHHRETLKHNRQPTDPSAYMNIATELPPELSLDTIKPPQSAPLAPVSAPLAPVSAPLAPVSAPLAPHTSFAQAPPYSNLKKGGSKPTYRTWLRNTQKNKPSISKPSISKPSISNPSISKPSISILDTEPVETNINNNNNKKGEEVSFNFPVAPATAAAIDAAIDDAAPASPAPPAVAPAVAAPPPYKPSLAPRRKRITRTLKYKLGKHNDGTVSVLIKNSQTRRKIQNEQSLLKQKSILDIKNYLRKNNLLKVGTQAPNDVLRHLYEQSILAGQVENKSKENLIHNYFNDEVK
jgi:hypothetical protein